MNEEVISRTDLFKLPEYSCSIPTGTTIGKRWRYNVHAYNTNSNGRVVPEEQHEWMIGEYIEHKDPDKVGIKWAWAVDKNHTPHRGKKKSTEPT